ncbi:hypothetical protein Pst134EB_026363 [Puccinia striiformis f. sp. tritici]|nr:hypothetical protein Pst134EB_026363 [Puccinia striiformis f. sp. tritici]
MSMTLFYHIVIGLIFYLSGDAKMTNKDWMQLFMVLSNSGSYLLLAALLVQMLRIISEGREQAHRIARSRKNSDSEDSILEYKKTHPNIKLMT